MFKRLIRLSKLYLKFGERRNSHLLYLLCLVPCSHKIIKSDILLDYRQTKQVFILSLNQLYNLRGSRISHDSFDCFQSRTQKLIFFVRNLDPTKSMSSESASSACHVFCARREPTRFLVSLFTRLCRGSHTSEVCQWIPLVHMERRRRRGGGSPSTGDLY